MRTAMETKSADSVREIIDSLFARRSADFGSAREAYRGHVWRVYTYARALAPEGAAEDEAIAVAAFFHDFGLFTERTMDYLDPSLAMAVEYLKEIGREDLAPQVEPMIVLHHKLTPVRGNPAAEAFRRADLIDLTAGRVRFGLTREFIRQTEAAYPVLDFRKNIFALVMGYAVRHPLKPFPMIRSRLKQAR